MARRSPMRPALLAPLLLLACDSGQAAPQIRTATVAGDAAVVDPELSAGRTKTAIGGACAVASDCATGQGAACLHEIDPGAAFDGALAAYWEVVGVGQPAEDDAGLQDDEDAGGSSDEDGGARTADPPPPVPPMRASIDLEVAAPGGYCSQSCRRHAECGPGAGCFSVESFLRDLDALSLDVIPGGFLSEAGLCLKPCDRDGDCRVEQGYVCRHPLQNFISINQTASLGLRGRLYCLPPAPPIQRAQP